MKGDFSRLRFDLTKQYDAVLLQQGRVALDADANEATAIAVERDRATAADVIGPAGAPESSAGFAISVEASGKLGIGPGTYYVEGRRVTNRAKFLHDAQPDLPAGAPVFVAADGTLSATPANGRYIAYLDVWHRHVTAIEDASLQEEALGVDTTTRLKLTAQVRFLRAAAEGTTAVNCDAPGAEWDALIAPPGGTLAARGKPGDAGTNPCAFPETAGYRRLENHLYRVEIHRSGTAASGATFKWSRDNAAFATQWLESNGDTLTLADTGRDAVSGLKPGQWVELTDDDKELSGTSGTLVRLLSVTGTRVRLDTATADGSVAIADFGRNPKLRGWDSPGAVTVSVPGTNDGFLALESGLEVAFAPAGRYRAGDYWVIPARSGSGVEWPMSGTTPVPQTPLGIRHAFARLAILDCVGGAWTLVGDCRSLFPPLTGMRQIAMLGGDGQEALADPTAPAVLCPLPSPLRLGVFRGTTPVVGARIRISILTGNGKLDPVLPSGGVPVSVKLTGAEGEATFEWALDPVTPAQQVRAVMLDADGQPEGLPVTFGASLSTAAQTSFDPASAPSLAGVVTVQRAIEELASRTGGGCTEVMLTPGTDWVKILMDLPRGRDATVCFRQGDYTTDKPMLLEELGNVVMHGNGAATRIIGKEGATVLEFRNCASLDIRDLTVIAAADLTEKLEGRPGALTVSGGSTVLIDGLSVRCGAAPGDFRTCITVRGDVQDGRVTPLDSVRVTRCRLEAGFGQGGILVTDALDSVVNDNSFTVSALPEGFEFEKLIADPDRLALLARQLARDFNVSGGVTQPSGGIKIGDYVVEMNSMLKDSDWAALVASNPPAETEIKSADGVRNYIKRVSGAALTEATPAPRAFLGTAERLRRTLGAQNVEMTNDTVAELIRGGDIQVVEDPGAANLQAGENRVTVPAGRMRVAFTSQIPQEPWSAIVQKFGGDFRSENLDQAADRIDRVARRFIIDPELRKESPAISAWFEALKKGFVTVGGQAITVSGTVGDCVVVSGNEGINFAEAVHAALSREGDDKPEDRSFRTLAVTGNRFRLRLPVERMFNTAGIVIGSALRVRANGNELDHADPSSDPRTFSDGLQVTGYLGDFVHVRDNAVSLARTGVRVVAENRPEDKVLQWLASDNHAANAQMSVIVPPEMRREGNTP